MLVGFSADVVFSVISLNGFITKDIFIKRFIIFAPVLLLIGCQSTPEVDLENTQTMHIEIASPSAAIDLAENMPSPEVNLNHEQTVLPVAGPINHKDNYFAQSEPITKVSTDINKAVCKDNVAVTYRVTDQNGVQGVYNAQVQAQGVVVAVSHDKKQFKIRSTGWFSDNLNLQKWQPFLKSAPLAEGILLTVGAQFWDPKKQWYFCGGIST